MMDLVDYLEHWVATKPDDTLYGFLDGRGEVADCYSFRRLHDRSCELAAHFAATARIGYGSTVLLVYPPGLDFIAAFFACARLGAVPVPVQPPDASGVVGGLERLAHVMLDSGAATALTSSLYLGQLHKLAGRSAEAAECLATAPLAGL